MRLWATASGWSSGGYGFPGLKVDTFTKIVAKLPLDIAEQAELAAWAESLRTGHYGLAEGYDKRCLDQAGWGVVFAKDSDPALRAALAPLLDHRREQAGGRYWEYGGGQGYLPGDTKLTWLARAPRNVGPGPVDPDRAPYFLLIVGDPETIPFSFQTQLDVQFAVGRVCFDEIEEYARYARSVARAERENLTLDRKAGFFGAANPNDRHTQASLEKMIIPLADTFGDNLPPGAPEWTVQRATGAAATKARLRQLLGGSETPALLFTATHGLGST